MKLYKEGGGGEGKEGGDGDVDVEVGGETGRVFSGRSACCNVVVSLPGWLSGRVSDRAVVSVMVNDNQSASLRAGQLSAREGQRHTTPAVCGHLSTGALPPSRWCLNCRLHNCHSQNRVNVSHLSQTCFVFSVKRTSIRARCSFFYFIFLNASENTL